MLVAKRGERRRQAKKEGVAFWPLSLCRSLSFLPFCMGDCGSCRAKDHVKEEEAGTTSTKQCATIDAEFRTFAEAWAFNFAETKTEAS